MLSTAVRGQSAARKRREASCRRPHEHASPSHRVAAKRRQAGPAQRRAGQRPADLRRRESGLRAGFRGGLKFGVAAGDGSRRGPAPVGANAPISAPAAGTAAATTTATATTTTSDATPAAQPCGGYRCGYPPSAAPAHRRAGRGVRGWADPQPDAVRAAGTLAQSLLTGEARGQPSAGGVAAGSRVHGRRGPFVLGAGGACCWRYGRRATISAGASRCSRRASSPGSSCSSS